MTMTGGCLCGEVRYEISGEPEFVGRCYCLECQKESGAGHLTILGALDENVTFTGKMRTFVKRHEVGMTITRSSWPNCANTLVAQTDWSEGASLIRAGTLDESDGLESRMRIAVHCKSARSWDRPPDSLVQYPGQPPDS